MRKKILYVLLLLALIFLITWINTHPLWVERYYALMLYPGIGASLRFLLNWLPFSLGDLLYLTAGAYLLWQFIKFIRSALKKRFRPALSCLLNMVLFAEATLLIFYLFWGMNYFRLSTASRLELPREKYELTELRPAAEYLITRANHYRAQLSRQTARKIRSREIYREAEKAFGKLGAQDPDFLLSRPRVKPSMFTVLINFMGVAGYFNPFTGEAQLNYAMPVHVKPFVACHELAHQAGFGPEDAASFAGFLASTHSADVLFQYSAYYTAMEEVMNEISRMDWETYKELYALISPEVRTDLDTEYYYWSYFRGPIDALSDIFYDRFLKVNNQPSGLRTYNEMISLLIAHYKKEGILD